MRQKRIELLEKKRIHLTNKMEKAAENRQRNLDDIIKRLKENARGLENSFINAMEVEQTRLTLQLKEQDREQRLINLAEERSKQVKEKASKEAALDERKRTAEQVICNCHFITFKIFSKKSKRCVNKQPKNRNAKI